MPITAMCSHTNIIQGKKYSHREKENLIEYIFEHAGGQSNEIHAVKATAQDDAE